MSETDVEEQVLLLQWLKRESVALEAAEFRAQHKGHYLLGRIPDDIGDDWSFVTDVRSFGFGQGNDSLLAGDSTSNQLLWKVEKSHRNAWQRRISVGRAKNNDIIIRHHTVSKLHAHFLFGMLAKLRQLHPSADLLLSDVGSSNGTSVDGQRLKEGDVVPVSSGNQIKFGDVGCQLLDETQLYRKLRSIIV